MWCRVNGWVTPNLSKDHKAFICRVKQSKTNSHVGQKCLCYIGMVGVGSKWLERVASQNTQTLPLPWLTDCHPLWISTTHINNTYITHKHFCPTWLFFLDCLTLWCRHFKPSKCSELLNKTHSVTSLNNWTFSNTAARTQTLAHVCMFRPAKNWTSTEMVCCNML